MNRKQLLNILKLVVSIVLLIIIFNTIDMQAFFKIVKNANPLWMFAALCMVLLGVFIRAVRWQILLTSIDVHVPIVDLTAIYFVGFLFNNLLPSGLGGDAIRMVELNAYTEHGSDAVTSVVVDRFLGLSALQLIAAVAVLFSWGAIPAAVAYFTILAFIASLLLGLLLINQTVYQTLQVKFIPFRMLTDKIKLVDKLAGSFQSYPMSALGKAYLVALVFNVSLILMNMFIGLALGAQATLAQYAVFVPITSLVLIIPISFGGLGVREETYRQLFGQIGVPGEIAVAISLTVYLLGNIVTGLIGGIIYVVRSALGVVTEKG